VSDAVAPFRPALPVVMSALAGYVDTAGFLALQGLFTAHVTGNFVTLGATLVLGTTGAISKLMALPTFCVAIIAARLVASELRARGRAPLRLLLTVKLGLLTVGGALAIWLGPFHNGDSWQALLTGMTLVTAMAIQNAVHRVHLGAAPPSTLMTGNTTQIMLDLADLWRGETADRAIMTARLRKMGLAVGAFALGCAGAALLYSQVSVWCFVVPPVLAAISLALSPRAPVTSRSWSKPGA